MMNAWKWIAAELRVLWLLAWNEVEELRIRAHEAVERTKTVAWLIAIINIACITIGLLAGSRAWLVAGALLVTVFTAILWARIAILAELLVLAGAVAHWFSIKLPARPTQAEASAFIRKVVCVFAWILVANLYAIVFEVWRNPVNFLVMIVVWFAMLYLKFAYELKGPIFKNLAIGFVAVLLAWMTIGFFANKPEVQRQYDAIAKKVSPWFASKPAAKTTSSGTTIPVVSSPPVVITQPPAAPQTLHMRKKMKPSKAFLDAKMDVREWVDYVDREFTDIRE